jgi:hypothetical protein
MERPAMVLFHNSSNRWSNYRRVPTITTADGSARNGWHRNASDRMHGWLYSN